MKVDEVPVSQSMPSIDFFVAAETRRRLPCFITGAR
jgi:hypothetical protein